MVARPTSNAVQFLGENESGLGFRRKKLSPSSLQVDEIKLVAVVRLRGKRFVKWAKHVTNSYETSMLPWAAR